jgi:hypothetical protein
MGNGTVRISFREWLFIVLVAALVLAHGALPARADVEPPQALPDAKLAAALVRSTLLSLNEANLTANYSVLRAASAPDFQRLYSEERLAAIFSILRDKHVDLAAAAMHEPVIRDATYVPSRRAVVLKGTVPPASAMPRFETNFSFAYQYVEGRWRLFRLDLSIDPARQPLQTVGTAL